jgi:FKBP12-rapamycin complex-associated protein
MVYHAYAKALHYKEQEFFIEASFNVVEDLIVINQKLQQHDAAYGTLEYATREMGMTTDVEWFEKLNRWDQAFAAWSHLSNSDEPTQYDKPRIEFGMIQSLHQLGEWEELSDLVQIRWPTANQEERRQMAPLAATASWSLNQWDLMDDYISAMRTDSADRSFFKSILLVHRNQYGQASRHIMRAREKLDNELTSLTGESYGRAYE